MATVIKKTADQHGHYRIIRNVNLGDYPSADWLHDPDFSGVVGAPTKYWKVSGSSVVEMSQSEKDAVDDDANDIANVSVAGTLAFEKSGYCRNRWLGFGSSKSSNSIPYIAAHRMVITAITFSNATNSVETDIEIYRNGLKIHTWEVRNKRWAWKAQGLHTVTFDPGDKVGVYLRDKGTDPRHVIVTLHYTIWSQQVGEGGSSIL